MSEPTTAQRLEFFGMTDESHLPPHISEPPPGPRDVGPSAIHKLHGAICAAVNELRITTQPARQNARGHVEPARVCIRFWHKDSNGRWWTDKRNPGITIEAKHAAEFGRAVAAAVAALAEEAHREAPTGGK